MRRTTKTRKSKVAGAVISGTLLIAVLTGDSWLTSLPLSTVSQILVIVSVVLGLIVFASFRRGVWSLPFLFYGALALFHVGAFVSPAVDGTPPEFLKEVASSWYTQANMSGAGVHIITGLLSYVLGLSLVALLIPRLSGSKPECAPEPHIGADGTGYRSYSDVGALAVIVSTGFWFYIVGTTLGLGFTSITYRAYLQATIGHPMGLINLMLSVGTMLTILAPKRRLARVALIAFVIYGTVAFALGLRSDVLIPLVSAMAVYGVTHIGHLPARITNFLTSGRMALVLGLAGLLAISAAQQIRGIGLRDISGKGLNISVLRGVEEMGYSARVVVTSVGWHEHGLEPYKGGDTYLAPMDRALRAIMGLPRIPADADWRLMNVEIGDRIGQIGGSMIAEAHHNFSFVGPVLVLILVGVLVGTLSSVSVQGATAPLLGLTSVLLFMHVRNSFAPLLKWALVGLLLIFLGRVVEAARRSQ